jgi:anti-sigma regulatory factor (Ser/Thr protein kinase)
MGQLLVNFEAPLDKGQVEHLRHEVLRWLGEVGFPEDTAYRVATVVDELFCNTMEYSGAHWVQVGAAQRGDDVAVFLRDDGVPFDPWVAGAKDYSLYLESDTDRRLGLYLVTRLAREVTYQRKEGINAVRFLVGRTLPDPMNPQPHASTGEEK